MSAYRIFHAMLLEVHDPATRMELPTVGRYENSPRSFFAVAVPKVLSGLFLSQDVRNRNSVPIVMPFFFSPESTDAGETMSVIAICETGISPNNSAAELDMNKSPELTNSSATIAPIVNGCIQNLRSRSNNTSPTCALRTLADVSPINTWPRATMSAIASPPIARTYALVATMVAMGIRHPSPSRNISLPARV